ncbi:MAG TPA: heme ABC exporter ATP-binding protein CcmA [Firmicutes bacterium]|nr:heme ABC exporter ATP-binding protein CcmA [Bacillota bacterium]
MLTRVEIKNLAKAYGQRRLFSNISVTIEYGTVFAVAGPNGAGKTTLLRIICGLLPPSAGEVSVSVDGRVLSAGERRAKIGLVSPDLELYNELSALENLEFFARLRGLPFSPEEARDLLAYVGLKGRENDLLAAFSSGLRQRLKLAYALQHRPPILVLDEPAANLDGEGVRLVENIIACQRKRGIVIMATNEPGEVANGDRILTLGPQGHGCLPQGPAR